MKNCFIKLIEMNIITNCLTNITTNYSNTTTKFKMDGKN